jgi:hypothetical protein
MLVHLAQVRTCWISRRCRRLTSSGSSNLLETEEMQATWYSRSSAQALDSSINMVLRWTKERAQALDSNWWWAWWEQQADEGASAGGRRQQVARGGSSSAQPRQQAPSGEHELGSIRATT